MLAAYRIAVQGLLQNPSAPATLYATADVDRWINTARGQVAGEGECIRALGTIATSIGVRNYNFSAIGGPVGSNGIQGVIHVRSARYASGGGFAWIEPRPWEWFELFNLNNVTAANGVPTTWAQYGQGAAGAGTGSAASGSFYLDPPPNAAYTFTLDCVCYPAALVDDTTVEPIPYLWTDAVPFFAAYYALLSSQTSGRTEEALNMLKLYQEFMGRARRAANPDVNRWMYAQAPDPALTARMAQPQQREAG